LRRRCRARGSTRPSRYSRDFSPAFANRGVSLETFSPPNCYIESHSSLISRAFFEIAPLAAARRLSLARRFNANGIKLSIDALEILDVAQSHRVRTFFTRIPSSRFMSGWRLLKEPVQFVTDCFQVLAR